MSAVLTRYCDILLFFTSSLVQYVFILGVQYRWHFGQSIIIYCLHVHNARFTDTWVSLSYIFTSYAITLRVLLTFVKPILFVLCWPVN